MRKTTKILMDARALLARPYGWNKYSYRRVRSNGVVTYCAVGAISEAGGTGPRLLNPQAYDALRVLRKAIDGDSRKEYARSVLIGFNDASKTRKRDVLDLFDRAIELSKT